MSYKAEIELVVNLHSFKNIQIDRQGYAALRIQICDQSAPNTNYAMAYNSATSSKAGLASIAAEPSLEDNAFHSSTVKIQYADEKYYLNDTVQFKLLIESVPKMESAKLFIKFTLLFCSLYTYNNSMDPVTHSMESVSFRLRSIETGIFHFYEGSFTENYASSFTFTLFSMITDFKLHPYSMRKEVISESEQERKREKERESISKIEDLLIWSSKYIKNCKAPIQYFYNNFAKVLRYNSYLIRMRISQSLKNKKEVQLKLPKFYKPTQEADSKEFYQFFSTSDPANISIKNYEEQIYQMHVDNYFFSQEVWQLMSKGFVDYKLLEAEYRAFVSSQTNARLIKEVRFGQQMANTSQAYQNIAIANKIRKQRKDEEPYPIMPGEEKVEEFVFYEICHPKQMSEKEVGKTKRQLPFLYDERNMLVFLCHGFQASSYDMRIIQRGIKEALPLAEVVTSCANESDTDGDIDEMGRRLAQEVESKIKLEGLNKQQIILNFVGHSMGGIIARASLKYLKDYEKQLGFYCSLSSPHLGYMNGTDSMIKAGLWVMRKMMKESKSLDQLSMVDSAQPEQTFLFNLSKQGSLRNFQKVVLLSSAEDSYVPWHSARICGYGSKKGANSVELEMASSILGNATTHRVDVNFACEKSDLDGFIGRKAHINLIVNQSVFRLINAVIPNLFDLRET